MGARLMKNDPSLLEFDRFSFSKQPCVLTTNGCFPYLEIEYDYHEESSPPVDYSDYVLLNKSDVGRLITFLQSIYEEM